MPSTNGDVNDALVAYKSATDLTRTELENSLIKSLSSYAKKIVWLKLHQDRPDTVNEAVQYVMAHLADFRGESKFSSWVYTIVERFCCRELRLKINNKEKLFGDFHEYQVEGLASYELDGDARMTLDRLTKTLSADEKRLIDLKLQGYSTAELAQLMKITETAAEGPWRRLSAKLRKREQKRNKNLTKTTPTSRKR